MTDYEQTGRGKKCPSCGSPLVDLSSMNTRVCSNGKCGHKSEWTLSEGQKSVLGRGTGGVE